MFRIKPLKRKSFVLERELDMAEPPPDHEMATRRKMMKKQDDDLTVEVSDLEKRLARLKLHKQEIVSQKTLLNHAARLDKRRRPNSQKQSNVVSAQNVDSQSAISPESPKLAIQHLGSPQPRRLLQNINNAFAPRKLVKRQGSRSPRPTFFGAIKRHLNLPSKECRFGTPAPQPSP